jgi:hypothetical protein
MTKNRELSLRCIAYNMHRLTNLVVRMMISTEPSSTNMRVSESSRDCAAVSVTLSNHCLL